MNTSNKTLTIGLIMLLVGIGAGYAFGSVKNTDTTQTASQSLTMSKMMTDMNNELQGKQGDDFDKAFIDGMIVHHKGAIGMAKLALQNAKRPEIKALANDIISTQTSEISKMEDWKKSWYGEQTPVTPNDNAESSAVHNME